MLSENEYPESEAPEHEVSSTPSEPEYEIIEDQEPEEQEESHSPELNQEEAALVEESGLEEAPDEAEILKEKYKNLQKKLYKERKLQGQLKNQNMLLQQEAQAAKNSAKLAAEAAQFHFSSDVEKRISQATQKYKNARELGDTDAETEALMELQQANIAKSKMDDALYHQKLQQEAEEQQFSQQHQPETPHPYEVNPAFNDWAEENASWLDPRSPQHDPVLVQGVDKFLTQWNAELIESGYQDYIGSDDYTHILQQRVDEARARMQTPQKRRQPQMRPVDRAAAPIRSGVRTNAAPTPKLTRTEMQMLEGLRAAGYEAKIDSYLKSKNKVIEKNKAARGTWG